jgi:G3E family GTPase
MPGMSAELSRAAEALPIAVLTGFLGSGKTTFLQRALRAAALADSAVIINEIGEIGLDHYLVETINGPVLELPGGCLCCALREDIAATLRGLLARRGAGDGPRFRRVVIETTGLADPAPLLFTLGADPTLDGRLSLDRVVTMVDGITGLATLSRFAEAVRQVALADLILISKTDLAPLDPALVVQIAAINPNAPRHEIRSVTNVETTLFGSERTQPVRSPALTEQPIHTHGVAAHAIVLRGGCSRLEFARALGGLARDRGEDLLRVKGIVEFSDRPGNPAFVQGAQHALYPPIWLDRWPDEDDRSRLVFVVHDIERGEILARFAFARAEPLVRLPRVA